MLSRLRAGRFFDSRNGGDGSARFLAVLVGNGADHSVCI